MFLPVDLKRLRAPTSLSRLEPLCSRVPFLWWTPENTKTKGTLAAVCTPTLKSVLGLGNTEKLCNYYYVCLAAQESLFAKFVTLLFIDWN